MFDMQWINPHKVEQQQEFFCFIFEAVWETVTVTYHGKNRKQFVIRKKEFTRR